jgi:hypothetical protein
MQNSQTNNLTLGLNKDTALASIPPNSYCHANDVEFTFNEEGTDTFVKPKKGTTLRFQVPQAQLVNRIFRFKTYADDQSIATDPNLSSFSIDNYQVYDSNGVRLFEAFVKYGSGWSEPPRTFANMKTGIEAAFLAQGVVVNVTQTGSSSTSLYASIEIVSGGVFFQIDTINQQTISGSGGGSKDYGIIGLIELQDRIGTVTYLKPLAYTNIIHYGFVLSVSEDNLFTEIGVVDENNNWAYTRVLRTKSFVVSQTQPIDFSVEEQNDGSYSLSFTDNTIKPKTVYVPFPFSQDCCLRLNPINYQENTSGSYNLTNTDEQTNSQLVNNIGHVKFKNIIESGGNVTTGGKGFAVRFGINNNATTEWSYLSNTVPVIKAGVDSKLSWINIQGNKVGEATSKIVVLTVKNAKPNIFSFVELAVLEYTSKKNGNSYIVNKFDITSDEFDIQYTGNEQKVILDENELLRVEPILLKAKSQEVKGQRMNYACVDVATEDPKWAIISENAVLGTERFEIDSVGKLPSTAGNQRFKGEKSYLSTSLFATTSGVKQVLPLIPVPIVPPPTLSPYVTSTGTYTVTSLDAPIMQFNLNVVGRVFGFDGSGFPLYRNSSSAFNMYFTVLKNGVEANAILLGERSNLPAAPSPYEISVSQTINVSVTTSDILEFRVQLFATGGYDAGRGEGTRFEGTFFLNINQGANQSAFQYADTKVGEYQIPFNVANRSGYMVNDYRFVYVQYHLTNGYSTAAHPLGRYTENSINYVKGLHKTTVNTALSNNAILTDTLTTDARKVYNFAISVSNLDITDVRDELAGISFWVSDDIGRVLGSGLYLAATNIDGDSYWGDFTTPVAADSTPIQRYFGHFISQDLIDKNVQYANGDKLLMFGVPNTLVNNGSYKSGLNLVGSINEYLGSTNLNNKPALSRTNLEVQDAISTDALTKGDLIYNQSNNIALALNTSTDKNVYNNARGVAVTTLVDHQSNVASTTDHVNMAQYVRSINIYTLDYRNYKPKFTGDIFTVTKDTPNLFSATVYGGDVYTQKTIRKINYWQTKKVSDVDVIGSGFITYYAQNRVNAQLYFQDYEAPKLTLNLQGTKSVYSYLFPFTEVSQVVEEQFNFEPSYIAHTDLQNSQTYNPLLAYPKHFGARIYYSDKKLVGSFFDGYRKFRELNYRDLEQKNGDIVAIFDIRDQMVCIQPNLVGGVPYDTDTIIKSNNTADIFVGNGAVYANKVVPISSHGSSLKSLTLKGFNVNGNPQVYWLSDLYKQINRYDYSGNLVLSDVNNIRTYLKKNTNLIQNELDANLYYDTDKKNVVITLRAVKSVPSWTNVSYAFDANNPTYRGFVAAGQQANGNDPNFELIPVIYRLTTSITAPALPPYQDERWVKIPFTDTEFYNHLSIIYDEKRDFFTSNFTPLQQRYFNHNNKIFCPRGVGNYGLVYEMNLGTPLEFFDDNGDFKAGKFELDVVINKNPPNRKPTNKRLINVSLENGKTELIECNITVETDTQSSICSQRERRGVITFYKVEPDGRESIYGAWAKIKISSFVDVTIKSVSSDYREIFM